MADHLAAALIAVLRGAKRCRPVDIGTVRFYHFWRHHPVAGRVNIPWVKDLRVKQFAMNGYVDGYLREAIRYLASDRARFAPANAFVTPTRSFAEEVMRWYGEDKPWVHFANYPSRVRVPGGPRRSEVVYLDYSSTVFQVDLFNGIFSFYDELHAATGATGAVVANVMLKKIRALPHRRHIKVLSVSGEYDCRSRWGLLCNLTNFAQAAECLPRKLLFYLHCGISPLIHGTFAESISYCREHGIEPAIYWSLEDAVEIVRSVDPPVVEDRERFCIQARIGDLVAELKRRGGVR